MTETEQQREAIESWLEYWSHIATDGEQSWLSQEEARERVMYYRRLLDEYEGQKEDAPDKGRQSQQRTDDREHPG